MRQGQKQPFAINREARQERRERKRTYTQHHAMAFEDGPGGEIERQIVTSPELAESNQLVARLARSFIATIETYKLPEFGGKSHGEAVQETLSLQEYRRAAVEGKHVEKVDWGEIAAVAEADMQGALQLWARVREAADDELESGRRAATIAGQDGNPYALAQFLAIRDAFADEWQPRGGIESALIDMLTVAFSLQMYWTTIAHERATRTHDTQREALKRYEAGGWKSPFQSEAEAVEQAHRLADGYNRQFLRTLRQMRDLRRYAPPVIVNNGGQVNVGAQQVNINKPSAAIPVDD